jgi:hypothetical protein
MRLWPSQSPNETESTTSEAAIVRAVDAALGFVAGQRWVPRPMATALFETVRDVMNELDAPGHVSALLDAALNGCDSDPILAGALTDALLDIRNAASPVWEPTPSSVR